MSETKTKYSIVIVTRNRHKALELSVPLMLAQSRPPSQVIVIDSSDNPEESRSVIERCGEKYGFAIEYHTSEPGMTKQRNIGLALVKHEVVLFPDDDSLLFDGAMEEIMKVYERDEEGLVGGVCSAEATKLPEFLRKKTEESYSQSRGDKLRRALYRLRYNLERNFLKSPILVLARQKMTDLPEPEWLEEYNAVRVEWATGFRMSFRTSVIRSILFDESLGRYAAYEDIDVSLAVLDNYLMVGARNAEIYHYKSPERRDNGYTIGVILMLNMAYVLAKRSDLSASVKRTFWIFAGYKLLLSLGEINSNYGRQRLKGAFDALLKVPRLFKSKQTGLIDEYLEIRKLLGLET
ncbi:glycosyltransferase [Roseibium sp. HPY-6]|uniref:glycosyltransferase family 2 protein n=1 Tax=Roseibium sp. HPY-6 TaxID=3229852 RepID=UPI00338EF25A